MDIETRLDRIEAAVDDIRRTLARQDPRDLIPRQMLAAIRESRRNELSHIKANGCAGYDALYDAESVLRVIVEESEK